MSSQSTVSIVDCRLNDTPILIWQIHPFFPSHQFINYFPFALYTLHLYKVYHFPFASIHWNRRSSQSTASTVECQLNDTPILMRLEISNGQSIYMTNTIRCTDIFFYFYPSAYMLIEIGTSDQAHSMISRYQFWLFMEHVMVSPHPS
jgi:hypothetical protein